MKTLLILRHAKADPSHDAGDHERPLTSEGEEAAANVGNTIKENNIVPDQILSSTAKRAMTTAKLAAKNCGFKSDIQSSKILYEGFLGDWLTQLKGLSNDINSILIVGHNPTFEAMVEQLSGAHQNFPPATLAQIEFSIDDWHKLNPEIPGELVNIWYQ